MVKLISLFSGIGAYEKALMNLGCDIDIEHYCEIDEFASKSYSKIFDISEEKNLGDVTKIDLTHLPEVDLVSYSFPCQDVSYAGLQKGLFNTDGTLTRSGLFFEALKVINKSRPRIAIAENVKGLTSKKFEGQFNMVLDSLDEIGYNSYWKLLNAKDFGIPQSRDRVFIVSIRKDCDNGKFEFPLPLGQVKKMRDILEEEVDSKYFLSNKTLSDIKQVTSKPIDTEEAGVRQIGNCMVTGTRKNPNQGRVYDQDGLAPTLTCMEGGNRQPMIIEDFYKSRGDRIYTEYAPTLRADRSGLKVADEKGIRKLTPKECFRLMGFSDEDFAKAESVNSNSQLYKQAGNSIVVNVLMEIFRKLQEAEILEN